MTKTHPAHYIGLMLVVSAALACSSPWQRPARRASEQPTKATPYILGEQSCAPCHGNPALRNDKCLMIESSIWEARDPHRKALAWGTKSDVTRTSPTAQRAWEVGRNLGIDDVTKEPSCTGCHSVIAAAETPRQSFTDPGREGVTCVACHGAYREWIGNHQLSEDPKWRALSRQDKWRDYGMRDLRNPVERARVCLSCHVGDPDPAAHKTITHAMFEAGHPPLGGIELAAACDEQPRHWQLMRCKSNAARRREGFSEARMEQAELVAAGALLSLQRSADMLASQLERSGPDFARYDCAACHHELPRPLPSPTLSEQDMLVPGRPPEPRWSRTLIDLGLIAAASETAAARRRELDERLRLLHQALSKQPFGDRSGTIEAARTLAIWLDQPIAELERKTQPSPEEIVDAPLVRRMMEHLSDTRDGNFDFDSARQRAWALRSLWYEYETANPNMNAENTARIRRSIGQLEPILLLSLGWRTRVLNDDCSTEGLSTPAATEGRSARLGSATNRSESAARFDDGQARGLFEEVRDQLRTIR